MPAFRFQLEGVLRHRKNIERECQKRVAIIQAQLQQLQEELRQLDRSVQDAANELRQNRLIGPLDLGYLLAHRRFVAATQRKGMMLVQRMALVQRELDESRKALADAAVGRKVMEKLREKHYQRWLAELDKREREELDEIGMQLSYRQLAAEARLADQGRDEA